MRWTLVLIVAAVLLGLEQAAKGALAIGQTSLAPSFVIPLVVFIALFAPPQTALWTALLIGLVVDLATVWSNGVSQLVVVGPAALGYVVGTYFVLTVRALLYRRNPITLMAMSVMASALAALVFVAIHSIRMMYTDAYTFHGLSELGQRLLASVYTGAAGLVLAFALFPMMPLFGLHDPRERRFGARK
jgi:cell shape-determining protein MreD